MTVIALAILIWWLVRKVNEERKRQEKLSGKKKDFLTVAIEMGEDTFDKVMGRKPRDRSEKLTPLQSLGRESKDKINESWAAYKARCAILGRSGTAVSDVNESLHTHIHRFIWAVYEIAFMHESELVSEDPAPQCYISVLREETGYCLRCHLDFHPGLDRYQTLWWLLAEPDTTVSGMTYLWENNTDVDFELEWPGYVEPTHRDCVRGFDYNVSGIIDLHNRGEILYPETKTIGDVVNYIMRTDTFSNKLTLSKVTDSQTDSYFAVFTVSVSAR